MNADLKTLFDDAKWAAQRIHYVLSAVTGSEITQAVERRVPGIAGLVEKLISVDGFAAMASTAIPEVEGAIAVYDALTALGMKPIDTNEKAARDADKTREM